MDDRQKKLLIEDSDVFWMALWVHLHFNPQGRVFPCCLSAYYLDENIGNLGGGDKLLDTWNSDRMIALRKEMLPEFRHYTTMLDRICNENFREVFPELVERL